MSSLTVFLSGLLDVHRYLPETVWHELSLPYCQKILSRATWQSSTCQSNQMDSLFIESLFPNIPQAPVAALEAAALNLSRESHWLRADPIMLHVSHNDVVCLGQQSLQLSLEESDRLIQDLNDFLQQDGITIHAVNPEQWLLQFSHHQHFQTIPLIDCLNDSVMDKMAVGDDAHYWRRLFTECQMFLQTHVVNQARRAQGMNELGALWFWGNGSLNSLPQQFDSAHLFGTPMALAGLAALQSFRHVKDAYACLEDEHTKISAKQFALFDATSLACEQGDVQAWRRAMQMLEAQFFEPLFYQLKHKKRQDCSFILPGQHIHITAKQVRRWWKKSITLPFGSHHENKSHTIR